MIATTFDIATVLFEKWRLRSGDRTASGVGWICTAMIHLIMMTARRGSTPFTASWPFDTEARKPP